MYTANASVHSVTKAEAVTSAAKKVTADGLAVMTANTTARLAVATNRVFNGKGEVSLLEIQIKEREDDQLLAALYFPIRAGPASTDGVIRDAMCQVVAAIEP